MQLVEMLPEEVEGMSERSSLTKPDSAIHYHSPGFQQALVFAVSSYLNRELHAESTSAVLGWGFFVGENLFILLFLVAPSPN
jgi:hypothetical protein